MIWHPAFTGGEYWNTRYGIAMLPAVAVLVGVLASRGGAFKAGTAVLVVVSSLVTMNEGLLPLEDTRHHLTSAERAAEVEAGTWLAAHYDGGRLLMHRSENEEVIFAARVPTDEIVSEIAGETWTSTIEKPDATVEWVLMRSLRGSPDEVWAALRSTPAFRTSFELVYSQPGLEIYRRSASARLLP
jgi:hypothetical protein